jgi:tetratricopeptide (TPR) repeat protein
LFLGLAQTLSKSLQNRPQAYALAASAVALVFAGNLSAKTYDQNKIWHAPESFYNNIFSYGEKSARARNNLALYYSDRGQYADSIEQFNEAIKLSDVYAETRYNMALTYLHMPDQRGHVDVAIENLNRSLEIDPNFYRSYNLLSDIYRVLLNDPAKAAAYHERATAIISQQQ